MATNQRLSIMTLPQFYDGSELTINIVVLPRDHNPLKPIIKPDLGGSEALAFAEANLSFTANLFHGFSKSHPNNSPDIKDLPLVTSAPANALEVFQALADHMDIYDTTMENSNFGLDQIPVELKLEDAVNASTSVRKYLPKSYRNAFNFTGPRTKNAVTDDSYHCAIKDAKFDPAFLPSGNVVSWGQVYGFLMRQPIMAQQAGMIYKVSLPIEAGYFPEGGWLYIDLANDSDYRAQQNADPIFVKRYAARIPPLATGSPRQVFAPILFPVTDSPATGFDKLYIEAAEYDDGFAKIVHCQQPPHRDLLVEETEGTYPIKDVGVRLGWDDEQILIWYMRQLSKDVNSTETHGRLDAPLGVFGYTIDVRDKDASLDPDEGWQSLNYVESKQNLVLSKKKDTPQDVIELGNFTGNLPYQVYPVKLDVSKGQKAENFWLPMYFAGWNGHSMVLTDPDAAKVYQTINPGVAADPATGVTPGGAKNNLNQIYNPGQVTTQLRYGGSYQFRVRMQDLSGGVPPLSSAPINETASDITDCDFKRYIAPIQPRIQEIAALNTADQTDRHPILDVDGPAQLNELNVKRPKLGYPAVVYTGKYVNSDPIQRLLDQSNLSLDRDPSDHAKNAEHAVGLGIADPDVDRLEITVEIESLKLDKLDSVSGKEDYVHLYTTTRLFASGVGNEDNYEETLNIPIEYQDVKVLIESDDLVGNVHEGSLKLPRGRTIRLTIRAVCEDLNEDNENYYGFIDDGNKKIDIRYGEPFNIKLYKPSEDETGLLVQTPGVPKLQGIYMQPDIQAVFDGNPATLLFGNQKVTQNNNVQQLADQLNLVATGLTLNAEKGKRVVFGCSSRIRHTLAPDGSSITFASKNDLINHWLCCISLEIDRDWMWDALQPDSFLVKRNKKFTHDGGAEDAEVGYIKMARTASFEALDGPQRNSTRMVFIDAVEPKKDPDDINPDFPDTVDVNYTVELQFKADHATSVDDLEELGMILPITTTPVQIPKIVSAGIALSPYLRDEKYASSESRKRLLWIEFEEAVLDPQDTYFARVLANSPDQLISNNHPSLFVAPDDNLPLPIDPEQIRVVSPASSNDLAGLNAMQPMVKSTTSERHYILPLPPGLHANSDEMFGFFTYEFRVGHYERPPENAGAEPLKVWTTAQGRFGRRLKSQGIQHPAPALTCMPNRDESKLWVTAPYAAAVHKGKNVTADPPRTELWALLYAQVKQADNLDYRNILLDDRPLDWRIQVETDKNVDVFEKYSEDQLELLNSIATKTAKGQTTFSQTVNFLKLKDTRKKNKSSTKYGTTLWNNKEVAQLLAIYGLPQDSSLSVIVVETLPQIINIFEHITGLEDVRVAQTAYNMMGDEQKKDFAQAYGKKFGLRNRTTVQLADRKPSPVSEQLGHHRILRTSPLTKVPEICCTECK